jgi:hypothetical protein
VFVDPAVSRAKFDREVANFRALRTHYHPRGIWLIDATYPDAFFAFIAVHPKPLAMVAFGVVLNFNDYDARPLSVKFVNPMTREPLLKNQVPTRFKRNVPFAAPGVPLNAFIEQEMLQAYTEDGVPFLCLQGVREYHDNPAHTGDSWFLHRKTGAGTMATILETLWKYGTDPVKALQIQHVIAGFHAPQTPQ